MDQSELAVPGAKVKLTQTDTGLVRTTTTDVEGAYLLTNLPVGPYQLEVTKQGFSQYIQTGITLQVATNPTIEVFLEVGQESNQVEVEANASMVETQSTGVGQVIDSQRILDLPLIGRQVADLIVLAGAATAGSDPNQLSSRNYPTIESYSVAGGLATGTTYVLDGSMYNDVYTNASLPLPFPDALQEFKVETGALQAQYGIHSAATVNAVTKSGGNEWHGGAFEFVRNYLFDARQLFASTNDSLKRNQFGGTLSGPIRINKLFFFAAYQQTNTRQRPDATVAYVPTTAEMLGNFSAVTSTPCQETPIQLRDPLDGAPFPNNQIPLTRLSKQALAIAAMLPAPQDEQCGRTTYGAPVKDNEHFGVAKVDYSLGPGHTIFARYLGTQDAQPAPYSLSGNLLTTQVAGYSDFDQAFTAGDTYLVGGSMVSNFRITVDRTGIARLAPSFFGPQSVGIDMYSYLPDFTSLSLPAPYFSIGGSNASPATFRTTTLQTSEDYGLIRGNHQMAFGANVAHWNSNTYANNLAMGALSFTGQGFTGFALADFFTGNLSGLTEAAPSTMFVRDWYLGLYAQDAWKVKPGLTVSYGVRWEPFLPTTFANGEIDHFDEAAFLAGTHSTQFPNAPPGLSYPGDPGFPGKAGMNDQWKQFAPRIGMVWDPKGNGRMSVRASYGIFYDTVPAQYNLNTGTAPPWGDRTTLTNPQEGLSAPFAGIAGGNPFPFTFNPSAPYSLYGTYNTFDYNTHPTYVEQWNVSVERQIRNNWLVRVAYLGNEMVHLMGARELNPAVFMGTNQCTLNGITYNVCSTLSNTNERRLFSALNPTYGKYYGFVDTWDDGGTGTYNGMLLSAQKRMSRGVTVSANYTWSHCISNPVNTLLNAGTGGGEVYIFPGRTTDRGNCNTSGDDRSQVANMTAVAEVPRFTGNGFSNKWMTRVVSAWRASAAATLQSGSFFTVSTGEDNALTGVGGQRPKQVLSNVYGNNTPSDWVNPAAFAFPATGSYGNVGPGTILGPGLLVFNAGLSRPFRIRERQTIELRVEAENVLNHTNLGPPILNLNSPLFGQITSSGPARIMQFAIKYAF